MDYPMFSPEASTSSASSSSSPSSSIHHASFVDPSTHSPVLMLDLKSVIGIYATMLADIRGAVSSLWAGCMLRVAVLTRSWSSCALEWKIRAQSTCIFYYSTYSVV
ncbi:hypothetical protein BDZ89DRAFT_1077001 [Hymenopellis radicata]|nr:hypothetical protein BDZ89DRAFT_1077001 [Hymenopellis radicata]